MNLSAEGGTLAYLPKWHNGPEDRSQKTEVRSLNFLKYKRLKSSAGQQIPLAQLLQLKITNG